MNRRTLLKNTGGITVLSALLPDYASSDPVAAGKLNLFLFDPRMRGAKGDGSANDRIALQASIDECSTAGGGIVYLSPGTYLTGTVVLKKNVTLYLEAGATLLGSTNLDDYISQPGPNPGEDAGQRHLIFACQADNIGICGRGVVDGQGSRFWRYSNRVKPSDDELWEDVATYDWKPMARPSPMVEIVGCSNVHIQGVTLQNSAGWTLRPINCQSVFIDGIRIRNPIYGPNVDGVDITCSQNVFVANCDIQTADDAICLKSEAPYGELLPTRNITVTNCILSGCCNGLKIGTATKGGFENITFSNSVVYNNDVPLNQRIIAGIALEMVDGGWIEGVNITGIRMQRARTPIFIRRGNRSPRPDGTPGRLKGVMIDGVHATGSILTSSIAGLPDFPVEDVTLSNIRIDSEERGEEAWVERDIPEVSAQYPEARMFGRLPAGGLFCRHVSGLRMRDLVFGFVAEEARPAIVCDDARKVDITGLRCTRIAGRQPVVLLKMCKDVWLHDAMAPEQTASFLELRGKETSNILLTHCDLRNANKPVEIGGRVSANAVAQSFNILRRPPGE